MGTRKHKLNLEEENRLFENTKYKDLIPGIDKAELISQRIKMLKINYVNLRIRLRYEAVTLTEFFNMCVKSLLDRDQEMIDLLTKLKQSKKKGKAHVSHKKMEYHLNFNKMSKPSEEARKRDLEERRQTISDFALDQEEIDDIYSLIEEPDFDRGFGRETNFPRMWEQKEDRDWRVPIKNEDYEGEDEEDE